MLVPNGIHSLGREVYDLRPSLVSRLRRVTRLVRLVGRWIETPGSGFKILRRRCHRIFILPFTSVRPVTVTTATTSSSTYLSATTAYTAVLSKEFMLRWYKNSLKFVMNWHLDVRGPCIASVKQTRKSSPLCSSRSLKTYLRS